MKFPFLPAAFLLILVVSLLAGCSSPQSSTATVTGTPVQYTELPELVLSREEMPFTVMGEQTRNPNMKDPTLSQFGATRGYTRYVISEKTDSATAKQVGQTIVEYPHGNATKAFAAFVNGTRNADQSEYGITWLPDPGIGEESVAFIVTDRAGIEKPVSMIVFVKSDLMESVILITPSADADLLTRVARQAAAKIPG